MSNQIYEFFKGQKGTLEDIYPLLGIIPDGVYKGTDLDESIVFLKNIKIEIKISMEEVIKELKPELVTNHISGRSRYVVKGKGWVDQDDIKKIDLVKTIDGGWVEWKAD